MKILNPWKEDFHIHSSNFSDWLNSIDEIVRYAWEIWLTEIAITDHSDFSMWEYIKNKSPRVITARRKNIINAIKVHIWVEWDIIDDEWNICTTIQWEENEFVILSIHVHYKGKSKTKWFINAIKKHHKKIKCIGHPCCIMWDMNYDILEVVKTANHYNIPLEINAKNIQVWRTDFEKLDILIKNVNEVYVNSDAHTLYELKESRKVAFEWLKTNNYI